MFAGYASRLEKEVRNLYKEKGLQNAKDKNIKITTVDDIELFKTLISANKTPWLK